MVGSLAVAGDIQTLALFLFGDAQANDHVDHFVGNESNHAGPDHGCQDRLQLNPKLASDRILWRYGIRDIVVDASAAEARRGEHAGQQRAEDTADAVHTLQQGASPLTPTTTADPTAEAAKQRATAAGLRARGAFERMLSQSDDAYTAAAILMTSVLDGEAKEALQQKVLAAHRAGLPIIGR